MSGRSEAEGMDGPCNVVLLTDNFGGGTARHMVEMLAHRDLVMWPTSVICFGIDSGLRPPPEVSFFQRRFRSLFVRFPIPQVRALRDLLRRMAPPPAILHTYFFWPIIYGRILKRIGRVRILVENREDTGFKWGRAHHWLLRRVRPNADLVICVSPAVRTAVLSSESLPCEKVVVVENGVPIPELVPAHREEARRRLALEPGQVLIGMVANLNLQVKAVDRFIDAMPAILAEAPTSRFVIAGDGKLRPTLEARAERLGMKQHLSFLGYVSDVRSLYRALDISVLTSRSEGLSITLLESMAYAVPVVATAVGGNVDVVVDGETGYLVPFGDVKAFVAATLALCADKTRREQMGVAGRRRCRARYDIAAVSKGYERHYRTLIGSHPKASASTTRSSPGVPQAQGEGPSALEDGGLGA